jgi:transportin-3
MPISELNTIMLQMRSVKKLPLDLDLLLLEGMCAVVSQLTLPVEGKVESLVFLLEPVVTSLTKTLATGTLQAAGIVSGDIDRLTVCMKTIKIDGVAIAGMFCKLQPLLQKVLEVYATSEYICEKVCRCYKHSIRSSQKGFTPLLQAMTVFLSEQFQNNPIAAFLYAGAICLSDFSREDQGAHVDVLYAMIWSMSSTFFTNMGSLQQFEQRPDVVEEYFYLMAKTLQYVPLPFLQSPGGSHLSRCSILFYYQLLGILFVFISTTVNMPFWLVRMEDNLLLFFL